MMDTKKQFKWFSVPQWRQEQDYLREMHKNGWKFSYVSGLGMYHFEKCEPEDVVYQLDYNPQDDTTKDEYVQMFSDCGWEYIQDYVGYSYFRKPATQMNGEEEIFCDDESRLDMMKRVIKGRILPLIVIFFCCILTLLTQNHLDGIAGSIIRIFMIFITVLYLSLFASFGYQLWKYWESIRK